MADGTDKMNRAVVAAWIADRAAAREAGASPGPRVMYAACVACGGVLRIAPGVPVTCPTCEGPKCPTA